MDIEKESPCFQIYQNGIRHITMSRKLPSRGPGPLWSVTSTAKTSHLHLHLHSYRIFSTCPSLCYAPPKSHQKTNTRNQYAVSSMIFPAAWQWMQVNNVGHPSELKTAKIVLPRHLKCGVVVKMARRPVLRHTEMQMYFGPLEHPMSKYRMLKAERKLETDSLFLYVYVGVGGRPVVRNYVERWVRNNIWMALRERGWGNNGRVLPESEGGKTEVERPRADLVGTVQVMITNTEAIVAMKGAHGLELARYIVRQCIETNLVGGMPSPLLKPVQFPTEFLPHWQKVELLEKIKKGEVVIPKAGMSTSQNIEKAQSGKDEKHGKGRISGGGMDGMANDEPLKASPVRRKRVGRINLI